MPFDRRDDPAEAASPASPSHAAPNPAPSTLRGNPFTPRLLYLWRRKWLLLIPSLAVGILAYFLLKAQATYTATAQVYVNRLFADRDEDNAMFLVPNPTTVATLLKSSMLLGRVRAAMVDKFKLDPKTLPIDGFAARFLVKTEILQDSSVRKDVSPVIELSAKAPEADQAEFCMQAWLGEAIREFGGYFSAEAAQRRDALLAERERTELQLANAEDERARLEAQLPLSRRSLNELVELLAPTEPTQSRTRSVTPVARNATYLDANTQVVLNMEPKKPGLIARRAGLELEERLSQAAVGAPDKLRSVDMIRAERAAVDQSIQQARAQSADLETTVASMQSRLDALERHIRDLGDYQQRLGAGISRFSILASGYDPSARPADRAPNAALPSGPDMRVIASPVRPDPKTKASLGAAAATVATYLLLALALLGLQALRDAERDYPV